MEQAGHASLAFDLLELDGRDLRREPIEERKHLLANLLKGQQTSIVLNEVYEEDGAIVFREACKLGCEGIVSARFIVPNPNAPVVKRETVVEAGGGLGPVRAIGAWLYVRGFLTTKNTITARPDCSMAKRTLDQTRYWSQTNKVIGQQLRAYYRACISEELPPRLRAVTEKLLGEETEPSAEAPEIIRDIED